MYKTKESDIQNRLSVNTNTLAELLDCGRASAVKIGTAAGAKIKIGKRVLWNIDKIHKYLDSITEHENGQEGSIDANEEFKKQYQVVYGKEK